MKLAHLGHKLKYLLLALGALANSSCETELYCGGNDKCDILTIKLEANTAIDPKDGGCIYGIVENYSTYSVQQLALQPAMNSTLAAMDIDSEKIWIEAFPVKDPPASCPKKTLQIIPDKGVKNFSNFIIDANKQFSPELSTSSAINLYYLEKNDSGIADLKREATARLDVRKSLLKSSPIAATGVSSSIERIGFSGGKLLSLRSYTELMVAKKRFTQFSTSASAITQDTSPQGFIFTKEFAGSLPTADFAVSRVVWLDVVPAMGLSLVNCPTNATAATECANPSSMGYPNNLLPLDIKAFAISPMAELAVISESSGSLRFAALPPQPMAPPPLAWAPLANQPNPSRTQKVLLAFGDLDGNSTWDLIVLHQDAQQDVSVYRQAGAQLVYDKPLSDSWQAALGNTPISALALGDLDSDGRADVAISRGSQVTVWINQNGMQPLSAWTAEVQKDAPVRALAIGQVDGAGPSALVVASSTTPDSMGNATQYLHAYLGQ